jgi:riboflavin biosynthesis pyrimidine reductase
VNEWLLAPSNTRGRADDPELRRHDGKPENWPEASPAIVLRLFPAPLEGVTLEGLYLAHDLRALGHAARPFVYTNFIASLDGRIALKSAPESSVVIPPAIANARDWRLFQELAAQADVLITTGRYVRELEAGRAQDVLPLSPDPQYEDLLAWRVERELAPQPAVVIVSASLDFPVTDKILEVPREILVATGRNADPARAQALTAHGIEILIAGESDRVQGRRLIQALKQRGFSVIYSMAGPQILATLIADRLLDRLYLTQVHRILGAEDYNTIFTGPALLPPLDVRLHALYYDQQLPDDTGQLFGVYDRIDNPASAQPAGAMQSSIAR